MEAVKILPVLYHSAVYILFSLGSLSLFWYIGKSNSAQAGAWGGGGGRVGGREGGVCNHANCTAAYEESQ